MPKDQIAKIRGLLEDFDTAMLVTQGEGEPLRARPMAIAQIEPDCTVWFFTGRDTEKVQELETNRQVLVVCQAEHTRYVTLAGQAELVLDTAKARELWKESFKTWFPRGIDDPNLLLIAVRPDSAEYWDNHGMNGIRYFFQAAKAYAQGKTPRVKEGEQHAKVAMR